MRSIKSREKGVAQRGAMDKAQGEARRTLFVRNLPYSTSDDHLSTIFEKYGAIKSCFTVKDKGVIDRCKGYGYVLFEKREDAEKAKGGVKKVKGHVVQILFADKRPLKDDRTAKKRGQGEVESKKETELPEDVEIAGDDESESGDDSGSDYESRTAGGGTAVTSSRHTKPKSERRQARYDVGRIVMVTGIPESVHKSKLRKKCSKYGPLEEFVYPVATIEEQQVEGINGKIAHVTYKNYADAHKAAIALKGLKLDGASNPLEAVLMSKEGKAPSKITLAKSRLIVRNLSFEVKSGDLKKLFSRYGSVQEVHIPRKPNGHMRGYAFVQFTSYFEAAKALEGVNGAEVKGRQVAVDWLVPKAQYEASLQKAEETDDDRQEEDDDGLGESDSEMDGEEEGGMEGELESSNASGREEEEEEEEEGEGEKSFKSDVHEGKTVFVRNLPLESSEMELKELFLQFGRVRYARIVLDKDTGLSRGTAFVQFAHPASLQRCLEREALVYSGRQLDVSLALSPRELEDMRERGAEKTDKRNLYLAKEGIVLPGTEAAQGLTKTELTKRLKAQAEKKSKLANPNFYVSKTRLSVRNLPTQTTEQRLKEIFTSSIDTGKITQLKILRSKDRVDSEGVGRSKGFAFVEFSTHDAALTALRATNNNPKIFDDKKRLIVEFAVEDARIMRAREQKMRRSKARMGAGGPRRDQNSGEGGQEGERRRPNKKVEWQVKCKEKRLRRRERQGEEEDSGGAKQTPPPRSDGVFVVKEKQTPVTAEKHQRKLNRHRKSEWSVRTDTKDDVLGPASRGAVKSGLKRKTMNQSSVPETDVERGGVDEVGGPFKRQKMSTMKSTTQGMWAQRLKPSRRQSRKVRRGGTEQREERAFADMVDTYRRKLSILQQ